MLISCTSCNSKYLVNSADLKPNGRDVKCAKCGYQWFLSPKLDEKDKVIDIQQPNIQNNNINLPIPNLPSTFVKEKKVSVLNSILVVFFVIIFIILFWMIQNTNISNNIALINFYLDEFFFNLKLIFNDIAKIIYNIIN